MARKLRYPVIRISKNWATIFMNRECYIGDPFPNNLHSNKYKTLREAIQKLKKHYKTGRTLHSDPEKHIMLDADSVLIENLVPK